MPRVKNKPLVLVVEDDLPMRRYLRIFLTGKGYAFIEADSGMNGLDKAARKKPDLILVDLGLPDIDGLCLTKKIRETSNVPIIVVSGRGSEQDKIEVLLNGADDYLSKPFNAEELHARLQVALRHSHTLKENQVEPLIRFSGISVDLSRHEVFIDDNEVHLTPTEFRLLHALLKKKGKAVSHKQLSSEISTSSKGDAAAYVRVYMTQLRQKLEKNPAKPAILLTVPGFGFRIQFKA
ncbi:MAG: DNA-binding response regulator [Cyanobacteria bacterium DS2.3.42]|nr:DNA-binding response regulator [Cyanobacteria bacterium DS2.3.42]